MEFVKMLSGDTEIIKHIHTDGDYVIYDINLQSENFILQPENVRFRHIFYQGSSGSRVFAPSPCEGEYYIALQLEDTFGTSDEEFVPVKDHLCEPFEEILVELSVGGKSIGTFRYGYDDRKYYTFYTQNTVDIKKGDEISYKVLSGEHVIFTAIVLTKTKPVPKTNAILNIKTEDGHLRFTTRLASRVRIIAGEKSFEENMYLNNHSFEIPASLWGIRMVIEAVPRSEGGCTLFFTILEDSKNGFRQKSTLKKQVDSLICEFSDLDSLFSAVSRLEEGVCAVESSLYENGGSYRLIISSPFDSARLRRFFSEFCVVSSCEKLQCEYTKEHWQLIAPNNALSLLS